MRAEVPWDLAGSRADALVLLLWSSLRALVDDEQNGSDRDERSLVRTDRRRTGREAW
jgi:hypothetical protein